MNNTLTDRCVNKPNLTHAPHRASSFRLYPAHWDGGWHLCLFGRKKRHLDPAGSGAVRLRRKPERYDVLPLPRG